MRYVFQALNSFTSRVSSNSIPLIAHAIRRPPSLRSLPPPSQIQTAMRFNPVCALMAREIDERPVWPLTPKPKLWTVSDRTTDKRNSSGVDGSSTNSSFKPRTWTKVRSPSIPPSPSNMGMAVGPKRRWMVCPTAGDAQLGRYTDSNGNTERSKMSSSSFPDGSFKNSRSRRVC